ncbi:MAG: DAK2 domain-containing protein [Anaerolineae bacterium]|nr:DAK2 domain-containing protein [Anaerolineae bacterium]NIN94068.1 DAK2 domain-containing protein [Anaerolineae bacterium]NIQ77109.1 DAK2 domain-containing protein [Anaerolineae bacterium]
MTAEKAQEAPAMAPMVDSCNGRELKLLLQAGTAWLEKHASHINALNVFPVPDGDTGTNMVLTMQAALEEIRNSPDESAGAVAHATAHGALMGARGNSGVILSQLFRGIASCLKDKNKFDGADFAAALAEGSATAYKGVIKPVEGTILTVGREAADAAQAAVDEGVCDLLPVMERVVAGARDSVARTPSLLSVLREAGVVDAGGQGLFVILEGALKYMRGEPMEKVDVTEPVPAAVEAAPAGGEMEWGYCTEFILQGEDLDLNEIQERVTGWGDSVLVVGDENTIKVHVHTFRPGEVIGFASSKGALHNIKIDNMQDQHREYMVMGEEAAAEETDGIAIVAVVSGQGLQRVFTSLGVRTIVPGGQTMNPSTQELLEAIESTRQEDVIVLPNNDNVLLAAQKAEELSQKNVAVVPSETIPQGISALLSFNYQADLEKNAKAMEKATQAVQTAEITKAIRSVKYKSLEVEEGEIIGLLNGDLTASGQTVEEVVSTMLEQMSAAEQEIITVYFGEDVTQSQAEDLVKKMQETYSNQEWEVVDGGQPHYYYILSGE